MASSDYITKAETTHRPCLSLQCVWCKVTSSNLPHVWRTFWMSSMMSRDENVNNVGEQTMRWWCWMHAVDYNKWLKVSNKLNVEHFYHVGHMSPSVCIQCIWSSNPIFEFEFANFSGLHSKSLNVCTWKVKKARTTQLVKHTLTWKKVHTHI